MATSFPEKPDLHGKTARPESVGPHDVKREQENPAAKGTDPQKAYKPKPGDSNNFTPGSGGPKGPVNIGVKGGGAPQDDAPARRQEDRSPGKGQADSGGGLAEE
jgi:hypothetical protein